MYNLKDNYFFVESLPSTLGEGPGVRRTALILFLVFLPVILSAQSLNFGLREKQDASTLPRSSIPVVFPAKKAFVEQQVTFDQTELNEWIIADGWTLISSDQLTANGQTPFTRGAGWINATVPGTILTSLVDQGFYPDPYVGLNNLAIPDSLCRTDWWYRSVFNLPEDPGNGQVWLEFNGINYRADIWINGIKAGSIAGAFKRGVFNVTRFISRNKENILAVHIFPQPNPGIPQEESALAGPGPNGGQLCLDGPTFISSEGWDWVPGIRDRNMGIWQDVRLKFTGPVRILDPQVITDLPLPDTNVADISIAFNVENNSADAVTTTVQAKIENIIVRQDITLKGGETKTVKFSPENFAKLHMERPKLWWPNGYGKPALYTLEFEAHTSAGMSDVGQFRFGIREFTYELSAVHANGKIVRVEFDPVTARKFGKPLFDNVQRHDAGNGVSIPSIPRETDLSLLTILPDTSMAPYLVIRVNGKRIFCRGGNWGMDDAMKRTDRKHLEPYFKLHRDAGFNMVRNWTGESTEEIFYDLCDEYGLLVWNDFWLSTEGYNLEVNDNRLFLDNAQDVVRRFRNHACIAIWCPRNEGYAPAGLEVPLAEIISREDGTRYYQPNSRYMNLRPSGPWHYFVHPGDYFAYLAKGFNTEMGTPSVPVAASMRKMMPEQDVWPISDTWYYHDLHNGQHEYISAIEKMYGTSETLEDFCKKAQAVNYDSHRAMFESWNSRMWNNTSGLLLWMTHPAWPSTVWQVYSWDYETNGSYFGCMKACEKLHIQYNEDDHHVVVVNTGMSSYEGVIAVVSVYSLEGKQLTSKQVPAEIKPNAVTFCMAVDHLPDGVSLVRLVLKDKKNKILCSNDYWKSSNGTFTDLNNLPTSKLIVKQPVLVKEGKWDTYAVTVTNRGKGIIPFIKLNAVYAGSGSTILPAYFSDGYFNLLPGESRQIRLELHVPGNADFKVIADAYGSISQNP
jgi:hypothetical protein